MKDNCVDQFNKIRNELLSELDDLHNQNIQLAQSLQIHYKRLEELKIMRKANLGLTKKSKYIKELQLASGRYGGCKSKIQRNEKRASRIKTKLNGIYSLIWLVDFNPVTLKEQDFYGNLKLDTSHPNTIDFEDQYNVCLTKDQMRYIIEQNETEIVDFTYSEQDCYDYGKHRKLAKFKKRKGESSL